jgi:hypothetical protein
MWWISFLFSQITTFMGIYYCFITFLSWNNKLVIFSALMVIFVKFVVFYNFFNFFISRQEPIGIMQNNSITYLCHLTWGKKSYQSIEVNGSKTISCKSLGRVWVYPSIWATSLEYRYLITFYLLPISWIVGVDTENILCV